MNCKLQAAGLETDMDKTFRTSTVRSPTALLNIDKNSILALEKNHICLCSKQRLSDETQTTKSHEREREVVDAPLLQRRHCSLAWDGRAAIASLRRSKNLIWLHGTHARVLGTVGVPRRTLVPSGCECREKVHHCVKKRRMAGHLALFAGAQTPHCRDLSWWRQQQQHWYVNGEKWSGVHPVRFACWR